MQIKNIQQMQYQHQYLKLYVIAVSYTHLTQLIQQLESNNKDMSSKIAKDFSNKYGINIALNIKNKNYVFEGIKQYDIYIKPESLDSESLIINNNVEFKDLSLIHIF